MSLPTTPTTVPVFKANGQVAFECDEHMARVLIRSKKVVTTGRPGKDFRLVLRAEVRIPAHIRALSLADMKGEKTYYTVHLHSGHKSFCLKLATDTVDVNGQTFTQFERWPGT